MVRRYSPTSKALFSGLLTTSELFLERMTSFYTAMGDVTRSKPRSTWESKPPYYLLRNICHSVTLSVVRVLAIDNTQ